MTKPVYIHAGAHRTGTSSFQMCLDLNRAALQAAGYDPAYPGRDGIPGGTLKLRLFAKGDAGPVTRRAADVLRMHSPDPHRALILSEENISGRMYQFQKGRFYPVAEQQMTVLGDALKTCGAWPVTRLVLVVRTYAELFTSAYRKRAEDNPVAAFRKIVPRYLAMDRGWPALVKAYRDILAPQELLVLEYAGRGDSADLLRRLLSDPSMPLTEPARDLNLSATDAALEHLQARYHAGETLDRAAWQEVLQAFSGDTEDRGVTHLEAEERQALSDRYANHLDKMERMRGVTLLR